MPSFNLPDRFNLAHHLLHRHVDAGRAKKRALICPERDWTYGDLAEGTNRFANGLRRLEIGAGDRVLILMPDTAEMVVAYLGTIQAGAVAVPTNSFLRADDYAYFLDESAAPLLVTHSSLWPQVEPALAGRARLRQVVVSGGAPLLGILDWDEWLTGQSDRRDEAPTAPDAIAFWLWTSGSTGSPKAVLHRHRDWVYCCRHYAGGVLGISEADRCYSSSKLFHAYGLGNSLAFPLEAGAEAVLEPGRPSPEAVLRRAAETRPTLFFSVPTLYGLMLHHLKEQLDYDLSSIRLAVSAAEPLPGALYRRWKEHFGTEILDGIGSTEVLHIYASPQPGRSRADSTGTAVPGYELRILDEHRQAVEKGEVGDLWVRGLSTSPGYWRRDELTESRMQGEWFFTGDKFREDDEGDLHYAGRSDDMFRVSGQWVSPIEVESALTEHEAVLECAVVPWKDEQGLVKPKAFVIPARPPADETLAAELQRWVKERITPYKYPRFVEFVESLPKTAAGKIQRFKLRE